MPGPIAAAPFVWADAQGVPFSSTGDNQFCIRARGGVQLNTDTSLFFGSFKRQMFNAYGAIYGLGVQDYTMYFRTDPFGAFSWFRGGVHADTQFAPGSGGTEVMRLDSGGNLKTLTGTIASLSDRNAKTDLETIDPQMVLARVAALPISTWRYKTADAAQRHIGPMAQDFYAAFKVGLDDISICTVDESGVALAAIQGLNEKVEGRGQRAEDRMQRLETENAELKQTVNEMKKLMNVMNQKLNGGVK